MASVKTQKAARGTTLVTDNGGPPMRGEPELKMNKSMPGKMGGGTRDLSHSITTGAAPKPNGKSGGPNNESY